MEAAVAIRRSHCRSSSYIPHSQAVTRRNEATRSAHQDEAENEKGEAEEICASVPVPQHGSVLRDAVACTDSVRAGLGLSEDTDPGPLVVIGPLPGTRSRILARRCRT